jgi:hypothetical protein
MKTLAVFMSLLWLTSAGAAPQPAPQRTIPPSTDGKLNVIAFGAHPDDCDQRAGGTAAKYAALGHRVRFVSVTNGDAGHQTEGGGALAARRRTEAREAGHRIGIDYVVLDAHVSQVYEWLPWVAGALDKVPRDPVARRRWLGETRAAPPTAAVRATLVKWYGVEQGAAVCRAEAFEICEYGARPDEAMIRKLFPFLPDSRGDARQ